jgi:two-component system, response regulator PdtaR
MNASLRIAIADDEARMREYLWTSLERLGHRVVSGAKTGKELADQCRAHRPDLVITDIKMPDMDGIEAAREICREEPVPVILVTAFHDPEYIERAKQDHILAYLVKPIKDKDLGPAIAVAMERFRQIQALRKEAEDWKQALEDRKTIDRAKGILMKRAGLDEPEAFRRLQKLASSKSQKLVEIARSIITAEEAYSLNEAQPGADTH